MLVVTFVTYILTFRDHCATLGDKKLGHDWVVLSLNYEKKKYGVGRKKKGGQSDATNR